MRVAVVSGFACSLAWQMRLKDEGHEVGVWLDRGRNPRGDDHLHVGDGLVEKFTNYEKLIDWAKESHDAGKPTIVLFDASGMGEKADELRKAGMHVIGGGGFMDRLENDRGFGFEIAQAAGANLPPYEDFASLKEARKAAEGISVPTYFKSDEFITSDDTHGAKGAEDMGWYLDDLIASAGRKNISCMLQQKIDGVAISTARWWNGRVFVGPYEGTIEHKALMNDDIGPSTGCAFNVAWFYPHELPPIAASLGFDRLEPLFLKHEAPPGIYDMNAVVDEDGEAWFLEWTPRLGYDSEMTAFRLIENLGAALWGIATGVGGSSIDLENLAYSLRISVSPYPWEHSDYADKHTCMGKTVHGVDGMWDKHFIPYQVCAYGDELEIASPEGIVGLSLAVGPKLSEIAREALDYAQDELWVKSPQFRTDGAAAIKKDAQALGAVGAALPSGLLV